MARVVTVGKEALGSGLFDPAPAGTKVKAVIYDIDETVVKSENSPNKGKPQAVVTVKITDDFVFQGSDGKPQNLNGREVRYNNVPLYADSKNSWVLATFAEAVGWPVSDEGEIQVPDEGELSRWQGTEIVVQLGVSTSQKDGKKYNNVSRWLPAGSKTSASQGGAPGGATEAPSNPWA